MLFNMHRNEVRLDCDPLTPCIPLLLNTALTGALAYVNNVIVYNISTKNPFCYLKRREYLHHLKHIKDEVESCRRLFALNV